MVFGRKGFTILIKCIVGINKVSICFILVCSVKIIFEVLELKNKV